MDNSYLVAEIMKNRRRRVFLFELEGQESIHDVVEKNFGPDAEVVHYRTPTPEELILMRRSMRT